jgi:hypothetical protein
MCFGPEEPISLLALDHIHPEPSVYMTVRVKELRPHRHEIHKSSSKHVASAAKQ